MSVFGMETALLIRQQKAWELHEGEVTPEQIFVSRRTLLRSGAAVAGIWSTLGLARADAPAGPYPAKRNEVYTIERPLTPEAANTDYNNYYEFGTSKHVADAAKSLKPSPWTLRSTGLSKSRGIDSTISPRRFRLRSACTGTAASRRGR